MCRRKLVRKVFELKKIKFHEPYVTGNELNNLQSVFDQTHFYGAGKFTTICESKISAHTKCPNVLLTDSCTSALEIAALLIRDFEANQEVILPSYTFSSTASAFAKCGFRIKFAEIDPSNMMMDSADVNSKVSQNTAAIVMVHYAGICANISEILEIVRGTDILVIEDAAQAYCSTYKGKSAGTLGDFGCFSFHETKNLHAGLSGALLVNNDTYAERARHVWERGTNRQQVLKGVVDKYSWVEIGGSFYPTELQAAFLAAQLDGLSDNLAKRKRIFFSYTRVFLSADVSDLNFTRVPSGSTSNYHAFWVTFASEQEANFVRKKMECLGCSLFIGYVPLHSSPVGLRLGNKTGDLAITEDMSTRILRLPLHTEMDEAQAVKLSEALLSTVTEFRNAF